MFKKYTPIFWSTYSLIYNFRYFQIIIFFLFFFQVSLKYGLKMLSYIMWCPLPFSFTFDDYFNYGVPQTTQFWVLVHGEISNTEITLYTVVILVLKKKLKTFSPSKRFIQHTKYTYHTNVKAWKSKKFKKLKSFKSLKHVWLELFLI